MPIYERKRVGTGNFGKKFCDRCNKKLKQEAQNDVLKTFAWVKDDTLTLCDRCYKFNAIQCNLCESYFDSYEELSIHKRTVPSKNIYRYEHCDSTYSMTSISGGSCNRCTESLGGECWEYGIRHYGWVAYGNDYHYGSPICDNCYKKLGDDKVILPLDNSSDSSSIDLEFDST